jgi:uncharacterized MAPEG superfamily protein
VTTPLWCLFIGSLLPFLLAPAAANSRKAQFGSIDNNNPRVQTAALTGAGARASAAQSNAWEALALFTAAVVANHLNGGDPGTSGTLAMVWVGVRVVHGPAYIFDVAPLRSLVFVVGMICAISLFFV